MTETFNYIIIGAGSAGCVLAHRLSEDATCRVALIEAGDEPDARLAPVPGAASHLRNTRADWAFTTTPQRELFDRRIAYPRGRVIGGTSILNYMAYVRGNAADYDGWAQMGNTGWSYADVLPYFRKAESNADFADAWHGQTGPLSVETSQHRHPTCDLFLEAAQALGLPFNPDFNGAQQAGCGYFQATTRNGRRSSTAEAYLDPVRHRPNLKVLKNTHLLRIVVEKTRAVGVEVLAEGRRLETLHAEGEIILSAGAIGSPQIMMLSGLGPADHLTAHGVPVLCDLPAVGQNLEDHLGVGPAIATVSDPDAVFGQLPDRFEDALAEFERTGGGLLATHHLDVGGFYSVDAGTMSPQCQVFMLPGIWEPSRIDGVPDRSKIILYGWPTRSRSRGSVSLGSSNPLEPPVIDPNYLSDPDDLRVSVEMVKFHIDVLNSPAYSPVRAGKALPEFVADTDIADHVRRNASTIWHSTSTCRTGSGEMSVVGPDLRVHGVDGLRICDASVMPTMVSGNPNAAIIMVAEKGAALVKQ